MNLKIFPKHIGVWEGSYTRINPDGSVRDKWRSKLTCRFVGERGYHQVNEYTWDDGFYECLDFGICQFDKDNVLIFDNPRILGKSWETDGSIVLHWEYKDKPGSKLFEIIDLIGPDETHRIRVWKWALGDEFQGLTMIDERKVQEIDEVDPKFWEDLHINRTNGKESRSDK